MLMHEVPSTLPVPGDTILLLNHFNSTPVTVAQISWWIQHSLPLAKVTKYVLHGWPSEPDIDKQWPYFNCRQEISVDDNCLGNSHHNTPQAHKVLLDELHIGLAHEEITYGGQV